MRREGKSRNRWLSVVIVATATVVAAGCGGGLSGHEIVQNTVIVPGGGTSNVTVSCSPGKKVLGGGFNIETPNDIHLFESSPSDGKGNQISTGWNVFVENVGTLGRQTTAVVICADAK